MWRLVPILVACCFAISCGKPTETSSRQLVENVGQDVSVLVTKDDVTKDGLSSDHRTHELVKNAINREDWDGLRKLTKQGMKANSYIKGWEQAPVRVGKMTNIERDAKFDGKACVKYSFELEYADGKPHPHLIEIFVREEGTRSELLGFWEFGW